MPHISDENFEKLTLEYAQLMAQLSEKCIEVEKLKAELKGPPSAKVLEKPLLETPGISAGYVKRLCLEYAELLVLWAEKCIEVDKLKAELKNVKAQLRIGNKNENRNF